jgi:hypothetical protein
VCDFFSLSLIAISIFLPLFIYASFMLNINVYTDTSMQMYDGVWGERGGGGLVGTAEHLI